MRIKKNIFVCFVFCLMLMPQSCSHKEKKMRDNIEKMRKNPICIPSDKMVCVLNKEKLTKEFVNDEYSLKLVVYVDSVVCSSCRLKEMYKWDDFLSKLESVSSQIKVFFIFATSYDNIRKLKISAKTLPNSFPIYMDTTNIFLRMNPHIPHNPMFHTFLLDENNNVLLVGNPLENEKIEKLFWQILEEKLGKRE